MNLFKNKVAQSTDMGLHFTEVVFNFCSHNFIQLNYTRDNLNSKFYIINKSFQYGVVTQLTMIQTSKFVELTSPAEQVLLIDGRWKKLGKDVCKLYNKVYLPIKFQADIFCSHWDMFHTNTKSNNYKIRKWRVMVLVQYTSTH